MRRERESLISRLQERNTEIDNAIQKLQQDWILNQQIITELQKEDKSFSEEDDELSIECIQQEKVKEKKPKEDYNFVRPENPNDEDDTFEMESWKKQLDIYWKRRGLYADNKMKLHSLIWGQSTKTTQSKLETHAEFSECKSEYNSLKLLKIIREFVFKSDDRQYKYKAED